eukprot:GHVN01031857.1.p1 GENE.GHVN01031857.1~~GHVN01031857.1.p1  ORF type:complete len:100 (+),score=6.63 GHVN01031857.1:172-471(+)
MEMWQVWNHKFSKEPTDHSNPQCASSIELHCPKLGLPPPGAPSVSHWGGAFIDHPCVFHDDHMDFTSCQPYCLRVRPFAHYARTALTDDGATTPNAEQD